MYIFIRPRFTGLLPAYPAPPSGNLVTASLDKKNDFAGEYKSFMRTLRKYNVLVLDWEKIGFIRNSKQCVY